jgi:hypothetical protein
MALNELKLIIGKNLDTSIEFHDEIKPTKKNWRNLLRNLAY